MAPRAYRSMSGRSMAETLLDTINGGTAAVARELYREGIGIIEQSKPLCPVDTGTLRSSAYVEEPKQEGDVITVEIGYGGPAAKINPKTGESADSYAIYVHENLQAFHKVGVAKFLEIPFFAAQRGMEDRIVANARYQKATGGVGDFVVETGDAIEADYVF